MSKNKELITKAKNGRNRVKAEFVPTKFEMPVRTKKIPDSKPFTVQWISLAEEKPAGGQEVLVCGCFMDEPFIEKLTYFELNDVAVTDDIPMSPEEIEKEFERRPDIVELLEDFEKSGAPEEDVRQYMRILFRETVIKEEGFYRFAINTATGRFQWHIIPDDYEFWMPLPKTPYEK